MRDRLARSAIWTVGALLGAISTAVLVVAAAVPAILGLIALVLSPFRALWRRMYRASADH